MRLYRRTQFGNPILRETARPLTNKEILSTEIQTFIEDLRYTLTKKKYGVGIAAPQVGKGIALSVIGLKPTPTRPNTQPVDMVIINPKITKYYGDQTPMWEACISGSELYGKAMRHSKVRLSWLDEQARPHEEDFEGLVAQVIQHEVDHLNGILFVDRVKDTKTYVTFSEYKKLRKLEKENKAHNSLT